MLPRSKPIRRKPRRARVTKRGRIILDAKGMTHLRENVLARSEYRCENSIVIGVGEDHRVIEQRCKSPLTWVLFEMHHLMSRGRGGSDSMENCIALCISCHRLHHMGKLRVKPHQDWIANA